MTDGPSEQLMILVAGPYRGGTGDDPVKIQANVEAMEGMSLKVFRRGHLPVMGEWFALPLLKKAGSKKLGDAIFEDRKSTRLNSSHVALSRMPSSA